MLTIHIYILDVGILIPLVRVALVLVMGAAVIKLIEQYIPFVGS
jgi:hypothetical protein